MGDGTYAEVISTGATALLPAAFTAEGGIKVGLVDALPAGANVIGAVVGNLIAVSAEMTRPGAGDVNAYAAGDVISNSTSATTLVTLANIFRVASGSGYIVKIRLVTDKKSITPRLRLHFFNANNPTIAADNAPFKEVYADTTKRVGYYDMPAMTTATDTTNSDMSRTLDIDVRMPITAANGSRDLFVAYETLDAFTPASGQKFNLTVLLDNN